VQPEELPPNYWRAGPHTDWCCVTLLFQQPGNAGLECAANPRASGSSGSGGWLKVDPVEGGIAINIGDMLSRWSDDRLLSNLHRVRMPTPEEATPPRSRNSVAFFMQADKRVLIESQHGAITAGDYILGRIRSNFSAKK
jgi:isopenicillin N synthase-like dioxygenase